MRTKRIVLSLLVGLCGLALSVSCQKENTADAKGPIPGEKMVLMYACGHNNNLSSAIENNIKELMEGQLPALNSTRHMVFCLQHLNDKAPELYRLYSDNNGKAQSKQILLEEMKGWNEASVCVSSDSLAQVLQYLSTYYKARENYLIFSSHGTSWLPAGEYDLPSQYDPVPTSLGQELGSDWKSVYEMEISNFAEKLPFRFDAIILDACLMGGIEVAYELKDKCKTIVFSPTEILSRGMVYNTMLKHIFNNDIAAIGQDYIRYYTERNGSNWATCSVVDCTQLDSLASICKTIFSQHREGINQVNPSTLQRYYRGEHTWFYDLGDLIEKIGATQEELEKFEQALLNCMLYRGHTPYFFELKIERFSGLSTYLTSTGTTVLTQYYKDLAWNKATGYVQ